MKIRMERPMREMMEYPSLLRTKPQELQDIFTRLARQRELPDTRFAYLSSLAVEKRGMDPASGCLAE
jgi:hypothetical protein